MSDIESNRQSEVCRMVHSDEHDVDEPQKQAAEEVNERLRKIVTKNAGGRIQEVF